MQKNKIGFEYVDDKHKEKNDYMLPKRGTKDSAGYDFHSLDDIVIQPGEKFLFWTDVKSYFPKGVVLELYVRSSIGIKKGLVLCNTVGIVDSDYYNNESNDGNIGICLRNISNRPQQISKFERIAQGIFKPFLESDNCNTDEIRTGGIGHTNK